MKISILILFFLASQNKILAQLPSFEHNYTKEDTIGNKVFNYFSKDYDFVLSQNVSSYWWSGRDYYQILAHSDSGWSAWQYRNFEVKRKKGSKKPVKMNTAKIVAGQFSKLKTFSNNFALKILLDSLKTYNFFTLRNDSLNANRGETVYDLPYYRFDILSKQGSRIIASYAPEFYLRLFPDMSERRRFILAKDYFNRWWNLYCN